MSAPSSSRWSAFSVRPPSAIAHLRVADGIEDERGVERRAERTGQRADILDRGGRAAPHRVRDLARPERGFATVRQPRPERLRGEAGQTRARVDGLGGQDVELGHGPMLAQAVMDPARPSDR